MTRPLAVLCLVGAVLSAAAATAQTPVNDGSKPVGAEQAPTQATVSEVPGELLDKIRAELASEQSVSAGDVKVISAQAVNWPNGALGCPKPGMMYTQAIVPGYRVELEAAGRRFTYNASTRGVFKRCDNRFGGTMTPKSSAR